MEKQKKSYNVWCIVSSFSFGIIQSIMIILKYSNIHIFKNISLWKVMLPIMCVISLIMITTCFHIIKDLYDYIKSNISNREDSIVTIKACHSTNKTSYRKLELPFDYSLF